MSSITTLTDITPTELYLMQRVLFDAGYGGGRDASSSCREMTIAERLLVNLIRSGVEDPLVLANALEKSFGMAERRSKLSKPLINRRLIQGINP
ncbi:hypothetical protein [Oryzifoliimicrobium ureilyticus]|uniref:hypothetical protein n=1 Tax=Oryzifoliimicrobium ureilyticus TaxID=3113724 RepID=UPI0030765480